MTTYDWMLLAMLYLGIGNALTCHLYCRLSPPEQAYVGVHVPVLVGCFWPLALVERLCRARR